MTDQRRSKNPYVELQWRVWWNILNGTHVLKGVGNAGENSGPVNGSFSCPSSVDFRPCQAISQESYRGVEYGEKRNVHTPITKLFNFTCNSGNPEHRRETTENFMLFHLFTVFTVNMCRSRNIDSSRHSKHRWAVLWNLGVRERTGHVHSCSPVSSHGHYLIQMNYRVPPAEDRRDTTLENSDLAKHRR